MLFLQITLVIVLIIGIIIVLYSYFDLKKETKIEPIKKNDDEMFDILNLTIDEANKSNEDLNKLASDIFSELDSKYEELMVVYKLIEEKVEDVNIKEKVEINKITNTNKIDPSDIKDDIVSNLQNTIKTNRKKDEVLELYKQGFDYDDIAKKLNLGKREVRLIIDFSEGKNEE